MDSALLVFFISMIASAVAVVIVSGFNKPRIRRPIDSPPDKPVTIGI